MKYKILILYLYLLTNCSQKDKVKEDYMSQCNDWVKAYLERKDIDENDISELSKSACECGFYAIEDYFRSNKGKLKNDKMYWAPLEECVENQIAKKQKGITSDEISISYFFINRSF